MRKKNCQEAGCNDAVEGPSIFMCISQLVEVWFSGRHEEETKQRIKHFILLSMNYQKEFL